MAALLIKNLPVELHQRLRRRATQHHRSMNREVIAILEHELAGSAAGDLPPPVKLRSRVDPTWVTTVIRRARESNP